MFRLRPGENVLTDTGSTLSRVAPGLARLEGIRMSRADAAAREVSIDFTLFEPAQVLVGYFRDPDPGWLQPPSLEVDTYADARGGLEPVLRDALGVEQGPSVDIHALSYKAGQHTLALGKGAFLVAGVVAADQKLSGRPTAAVNSRLDSLDWLYEDPPAEDGQPRIGD
ncbi:hypothetical protein GCM10009841_02030 [Microlunatus panaciterrae]